MCQMIGAMCHHCQTTNQNKVYSGFLKGANCPPELIG